jgi:hypothetical protein
MAALELSLCVGVTGHRDIDPAALPAIEALVRKTFARLKHEFRCPILVLSSLAEGADRLVARLALELGHPLIVPLPLDAENYRRDFATPESQAEFDELLDRAARAYVVDRAAPRAHETERQTAYRSAGLAVARSCHVLLALWDGVETGKPGGTWEILRAKERGERAIRSTPEATSRHRPLGAAIVISTPRLNDETKPAVALAWPGKLDPAWHRLTRMARSIQHFNRDATRCRAWFPGRIALSREQLHGSEPAPPAASALHRIADLYAVADALAIRSQAWVRRGWRTLLLSGVLGVLAYGVYGSSNDHPWRWLLGYLVVVGLALTAYLLMTRLRVQPRFLDYRALAEALRVAFFWRVAGLPGEPADRYPSHLFREVEPLAMTLRVEEIRAPLLPADPEGLAFAITHWVEGQCRYFENAAKRDGRWAYAFKILANVFILTGVSIAAVTLGIEKTDWIYLTEQEREHLIHAMGILPVIGGALAAYTDRLGHETQARQYARMFDLFELASNEIHDHAGSPHAQREIMVRLAGEALSEHAQWIVLHRQRPFEFRAGG